MCGITGIVDLREQRPLERAVLARMNETQHHRGPDEGGLYLAPGIALGHRRLSIIDLATGQQPLANEDGSVIIVFNGEIYNYRALMTELEALGYRFRTRSDTEAIVHAWEAWGERCVDRLRGMFAFALWDERQATLLLARDRLGVKPLYYAQLANGQLIFGSELKSLLAHGELPRVVDAQAVEEYFALGYVPEPRTIFAAARKLPPGHTLVATRGREAGPPRAYWDVRFTGDSKIGIEEAQRELHERLRESVELRMISEVPLGAFLSGGVDSSAVVATMAGLSDAPVTTCSIAFSDPAYDESQYASLVAQRYRTRHFVDRVESDDFDLIDALARLYDEPYADSSALPTYRVCQLARRHVTVALSGDGAMRASAATGAIACTWPRSGCAAHCRWRCAGGLRSSRTPLPESRLGAAHFPRQDDAAGAGARFGRGVLQHDVADAHAAAAAAVHAGVSRAAGGLRGARRVPRARGQRRHRRSARTDPVPGPEDLPGRRHQHEGRPREHGAFARSARAADGSPAGRMAGHVAVVAQVEGRRGQVAAQARVRAAVAARSAVPAENGLCSPACAWFRGPLKQRVRQALLGPRLADTGVIDVGFVRQLIDQHQSGRSDHSAPLWSLLMFEAFLRTTAERPPPRPQSREQREPQRMPA
jgi:asparagine synthase (glutamine-hydrolysing)